MNSYAQLDNLARSVFRAAGRSAPTISPYDDDCKIRYVPLTKGSKVPASARKTLSSTDELQDDEIENLDEVMAALARAIS
jgi:hypothetical protein